MKTSYYLAAIFCFCLYLNGRSQSAPGDTLAYKTTLIRVIESSSYGVFNNIASKMIVTNPENQMVVKELKRANYEMDSNRGIESNSKTIQNELQKWQRLGFVLTGTSTTVTKGLVLVTTFVLQKS